MVEFIKVKGQKTPEYDVRVNGKSHKIIKVNNQWGLFRQNKIGQWSKMSTFKYLNGNLGAKRFVKEMVKL